MTNDGGHDAQRQWRVGGPERRRVIDSIRALVADNVARFADELVQIWDEDPTRAAEIAADMTAEFWRWSIDEAIAEGITRFRP